MAKDIVTIDSNPTLKPLIDNISMAINDARRKVASHINATMLDKIIQAMPM